MEPIIGPVSPSVLKEELSRDLFLCDTSHGGFQVYLVDIESAPSVLTEIGRLREHAFRSNGGGTGKSIDLDRFDLDPSLGFKQIVLWDPSAQAIAGGYRILTGDKCRLSESGQPEMPAAHLFNFSDEFVKDYLPRTAELSRSFITSSFMQSPDAIRNVFALDGLFEGICHSVKAAGMEYFFGKVTFYPTYPPEAFSLISALFAKHFADTMVKPHNPYPLIEAEGAGDLLCHDTFKEDFRALKLEFRKRGYYIPPILNSYINLASKFRYFGSALYEGFGGVVETGLLVAFADIQPERYRQLLVG